MNSEIDLLILTEQPIAEQDQEELMNETSPLYLECGRQSSPQFRTVGEFRSPTTERGVAFTARPVEEGRLVLASSTYNLKKHTELAVPPDRGPVAVLTEAESIRWGGSR